MTTTIEQRDDGIMFAVAGTSRSGKTGWVKQRTEKAERLIVRDPRGEYTDCDQVRSIQQLAGILAEVGSGPARLSCFLSDADADAWCELAYTWAMLWPTVMINEEVASVTNAGKARKPWGDLVRMGLYYGSHIYGVTQRPQECDKTLFSNATCKHIHYFDLPLDAQYVGRMIGVDPNEILQLQKLEWLEKWQGSTEIKRGKLGG